VHAVLNFVPKRVNVPGGCFVEETDIASKLEMLSFLARTGAEAQASSAEPAEGMTA
jgi:NADH/NAD ratio-sensing transcriptional regulator Rex